MDGVLTMCFCVLISMVVGMVARVVVRKKTTSGVQQVYFMFLLPTVTPQLFEALYCVFVVDCFDPQKHQRRISTMHTPIPHKKVVFLLNNLFPEIRLLGDGGVIGW